MTESVTANDPFNLTRFVDAQDGIYERALSELKKGRKRSHWIWFVFPQIDGLGFSATAKAYAIKSREEAEAYLAHPLLGSRLVECTETVLSCGGGSASAIFGYPDTLKFRSSMTLFAAVSKPGSIFQQAIDQYFSGQADDKTIRLLDHSA